MKEQLVSHNELTVNMGSSTLDVRSTMAINPGQPEQKPAAKTGRQEQARPQPSPDAIQAEAKFRNLSDAITYLKNNPELQEVVAQDLDGFMRFLAEQKQHSETEKEEMLGKMGVREHPADQRTREQVFSNRHSERLAPDYDARNQLVPPASGEESLEESLQPEKRGEIVKPLNANTLLDSELKSIILTHNYNAAAPRIKQSDEYALQTVSSTIKSFTDRMNVANLSDSQRAAAQFILGELQDMQIQLITSSQREHTQEEKAQIEVYQMSKVFEAKFKDEIELERVGRENEISEERRKPFREARQFLVKKIEEQVDLAPSIEASHFPPLIMEMASKFRETREMLINEILFKPYADKTQQGEYAINLYASGHLDELLATLSRRAKEPKYKKDREIVDWYKALATTSRNFWEMNKGLWTGNLEIFSRIAEGMNYDQFETMQRISGVAETMRLYDEKFMETMARDHRITSENLEEIKKEVRAEMIKMNEKGLMKSDYFDDREGDALDRRKLEVWELERAINVGFVFFNITFRGPELTSIGQLETGDLKFASYPYENAARMLNVIMTAERFEIAEKRGGMEFMERARLINKRIMADDGRHLGVNRFKEINGISVDDLEFMSVLGISGIFSGWRMTSSAYEGVEVVLGKGENVKVTNLWEFMKQRELSYKGEPVSGAQELIMAIRKDPSLSMEEKQDAIVSVLDPLIGKDGNLDVGLGMLLKLGMGNQGKGGFLSGEEGFKARKAIWQRVAQKNQLITASMLTNLVEDDGSKEGKESTHSLKNLMIRNGWFSTNSEGKLGWKVVGDPKRTFAEADFKNASSPDYYLNNPEWKDLKTKLQIKQETSSKQRQDATKEDKEYMESVGNSITFTAKEKAMLDKITAAGEEVSGDLADIVFPYMIFMNDMPFETFKWSGPGAQFFKRRIGDIGSYNKSISAITGMQDNLAGMKPEDVVGKGLKELQRGIESPNGADSGWTAVLPFAMAYMEMAQTYQGWESQAMVKDVKRMMNKATSRLQEFGGIHAPSMDEQTAYAFLHLLRHEGVIDHISEDLMRKYRGLTLFDIFFAFVRDLLPVVALSMIIDTPKSAISLK